MTKKTTKTAKKTEAVAHENWEALKSGGYRNGKWYSAPYVTGWYFFAYGGLPNMGPYKTFEEGLKEWKKTHSEV